MTKSSPDPWMDAVRDRRMRIVLRFLAFIFVIAAVLYAVTPLVAATAGFFRLMPFLSNSAVKVSILAALCLYAAADLERRHGLVLIVIIAHLVSVAAMLLMIFVPGLTDVSRTVTVPLTGTTPLRTLLLQLCALDGVITALLIAAYLPVRRRYLSAVEPDDEPTMHWPAPAEQILRRVLQGLTVAFLIAAVGYQVGPRFYPAFFLEIPFVTNSVVKISTLAMTAWFASRDMERQLSLVGPLILVHFVSVVVQSVYLLAGGPGLDIPYELFGQTQTMGEILFGAVILDGILALILTGLYGAAWRGRIQTRFLTPLEYRTLEAIAEIMAGSDKPAVPAGDIARNVDERLVELRTDRRILFRVVLLLAYYLPVLALRAPLAEMSRPVRSRFLKYFFTRQPNQKPWQLYSMMVQMGTRVGHQLTALGYYNDPRAHEEIGYRRFTDRPTTPTLDRPEHKLKVLRPWDVSGDVVEDGYDVCIIGTGAGGATAAYALAAGGMKVLMIERGQYIESRHFTEDELHQITTLYDRGMLQVAEDFKFSVLQGNCVGGSTTVNNAICFDPPEKKLQEWQRLEKRLSIGEIHDATRWLRHFMQVRSLAHVPHHHGADVLRPLVAQLAHFGVAEPLPFEANIVARLSEQDPGPNCHGCGNCNIGCGWNRKLSMLDHTLPAAQTPVIAGTLHILAECEAMRLRSVSRGRGDRSVTEVETVLSDGRRVAVRAGKFIVSAGAINSSHLLLQSGIGGLGSPLPVGRGLSFNMITPVFAEFDAVMDSFNGIQMGHYLTEKDDRFIIETWFSPPIGLATAIGGWFDDHHTNMTRARHMVAYGMVVGTQSNGRAVRGLTGPSFRYQPSDLDLANMRAGLHTLGSLLFDAGARRVILNTWDHGSIWSKAALRQIDRYVTGPRHTLTVASSHPQGGNAIGGVVDHNLMVRGYDNLHVADASVFPSSVQVNPQMSVMSVARYAAQRILNDRRS